MIAITLYDICPEAREQGAKNRTVTGVTDNTAKLKAGNVFVCIKGAHFDGHDAAAQMLSNGATAIVAERDTGVSDQVTVGDTRLALARLSSRFYGEPEKRLRMLAVTGTNGKTTTVAMVKHILSAVGHAVGSIGTAGIDVYKKVYRSEDGIPTTPPATVLYERLRETADNGAEFCVMEASSQALAQRRIGDTVFEAAAFTNLTHDHLDYHGDMESYFAAKSILFGQTKTSVICTDDEYGKRLAKTAGGRVITVGFDRKNDLSAQFIDCGSDGSRFMLCSSLSRRAFSVKLRQIGSYNIQNALCAAGLCIAAGLDERECVAALESFEGADGRLTVLYSGDFTVISDYAHTDDALDKMLSAVRAVTKGRLITVFGSAGDRDATKRPLMGAAVQKYSDRMIITSDNPAHEEPEAIIAQVAAGVTDPDVYEIEPDREKAIARALKLAQKGDVVVLAGKGSEDYQIIGEEHIPFSEKEIVERLTK